MTLPKRKKNRMPGYDYAACGAYFITICVAGRKAILWTVGADIIRPNETVPLSPFGKIVDIAINAIPAHYPNVTVDKYCIMPDHIHMILSITPDGDGRMISAPTVSVVVGSMKRWVSKQLAAPIWQKSYHDHVIRNDRVYEEIWQYIDENPQKGEDPIPWTPPSLR